MIAQDSIPSTEMIAPVAALSRDTLLDHPIDQFATVVPVPVEAAASTGSLIDFFSTTWGGAVLGAVLVLVGLLLGWAMNRARNRVVLAVAAAKASENAQSVALEQLRAQHEHLLTLLRKRDRYMVQYEAVLLLSEQQYTDWDRATWKEVARNQLAMTLAVRPVVYADYRARIKALSRTYRNLPGPALQAWQKAQQTQMVPVYLADYVTDSSAESVPLTLEPETLDWLFAEEVVTPLGESLSSPATPPLADSVAAFIAEVQRKKYDSPEDDPVNW